MDFKKFIKKLDQKGLKKNFYNILIVLLIGVFILLISSMFMNKQETDKVSVNAEEKSNVEEVKDDFDLSKYEQAQKTQLKYILSNIQGIGKVEVMISFESSEEHVPALDVNNSVTTTEEKDNGGGTRVNTQKNNGSKVVTSNKGSNNEPYILKTLNPKVTGAVIVAEGAENKELKYQITKTVSSLYNIPEHKVNVYSMKK